MTRSLAIALSFLLACGRASKESAKPAPAASVDRKLTEGDVGKVSVSAEAIARLGVTTARIRERSGPRTRTVGGEVIVPSGGTLMLGAPIAATIDALGVDRSGAAVKRGQMLAVLTPLAPVDRDLRGQSDRATAAAEARFTAAKARLQRAEQVLADGAGTPRAVEEARAEHDIAKAELDAAKQRGATMVTSPLGADVKVTVRAPHDGVVRQIGVSPGQSVAAGTMLVEVVGTSALWVRVPLFVADARRVRPELPATVFAFGEKVGREALPALAPPSADALTSTLDLVYALPTTEGFRPGERVEVALTYTDQERSTAVASSAVVHDAQGGTWLYEALGPSTFARRRVDIAGVEGDDLILARGPKAGTAIVSVGASELWAVELGGH